MLVSERCSLAAAASSSPLKRLETRKLIEIFFPSTMAEPFFKCIEPYDTCIAKLEIARNSTSEKTLENSTTRC